MRIHGVPLHCWLVAALAVCAGCSRPQPVLVAGCFVERELAASDFARQSGGPDLFVWPIGTNAGDDVLEQLGFEGHLLALPSSASRAALAGPTRLRLTGRVVKVFPSGVERHIGRRREHELAEAVVEGRRYLVHATPGAGGWNASLPSRCTAGAD
jgi:hypothetical protein